MEETQVKTYLDHHQNLELALYGVCGAS